MRKRANPPAEASSDLEDYRWLLSPEGTASLEEAARDVRTLSLVQVAQFLRRRLSASRAHLVLEQIELRRRARDKFEQADRMFFTRRLLEQATDETVAAYKAARLPANTPVADLCCGVGGDLLGLARRGPVLGVDRDRVAALLAQANVGLLPNRSHRVCVADAAKFVVENCAAWHADPDRRSAGRRTTRTELHEPAPPVLHGLLSRCPHAAIKLAPSATLTESWWEDAELEWISRGRECRQLVAWLGQLAQHPGKRRATILKSHGTEGQPAATVCGAPEMSVEIASRIGRYVFEPDPAVLAAKLEGWLATEYHLSALAPGVAYLTGDQSIGNNSALTCFDVLEVMPYRAKSLRAWLGARRIGRIEVKKRGVPLEPDAVQRQLGGAGDEEATVLLTRIEKIITAIVARRLS